MNTSPTYIKGRVGAYYINRNSQEIFLCLCLPDYKLAYAILSGQSRGGLVYSLIAEEVEELGGVEISGELARPRLTVKA